MPGKTKKCTVCKEVKPIKEFTNYANSKDGKHYRCIPCNREASRKNYQNNRDKRLKYVADRYHNTPGVKERVKEYNKQYRKNRKRECKDACLRHKLGPSFGIEEYEALLEKQGGVCAICGQNRHNKRIKMLSVDHCHETGEIRGLLCQFCNRGLGFLGDSTEALKSAIRYLEK